MSIDLSPLLDRAFFVEEVQNASEAIERALETYEQASHAGARTFEVVAPEEPNESWLVEELVRPLVYFCESEGSPVPKCGGVVVALFVDRRLYAIAAEQTLLWCSDLLQASAEQLRQEYGTHEIDSALR
jgi:hypothetical protein